MPSLTKKLVLSSPLHTCELLLFMHHMSKSVESLWGKWAAEVLYCTGPRRALPQKQNCRTLSKCEWNISKELKPNATNWNILYSIQSVFVYYFNLNTVIMAFKLSCWHYSIAFLLVPYHLVCCWFFIIVVVVDVLVRLISFFFSFVFFFFFISALVSSAIVLTQNKRKKQVIECNEGWAEKEVYKEQ